MNTLLRLASLLLSLVVHALTLAFVTVGCWIIYANSSFLAFWLVGLLVAGIGVLLLPRSRRLPADAETLDRASAPELHRVAEQVARQVGVEPPTTVAVRDLTVASEYLRTGRRRQVLVIGLPLWLALSARQRVVLLASTYAEAHDDGLIVGGALSTLATWRESLLQGESAPRREEAHTRIGATLGSLGTPAGTYEGMGSVGRGLGKILGLPVLFLEWALTGLVRRGGSGAARQRLARAHRVATDTELAEVAELARTGHFLAPVQAAALRGASVPEIRQVARACMNDEGVPGADADLLSEAASHRIDDELGAHYARAIRGFGLLT